VDRRELTLGVPVGMDYQMVFRQERTEPIPCEERDDVRFVTADDPVSALRLLPTVKGQYGLPVFLKALARLALGNRVGYFVIKDGMVVSSGFAWIAKCRHYWVEPGAVIIGGSWTSTDYRGQGIGLYGVVSTINEMVARGHHIFYADTDRDNKGGRRIIERCGWGDPIGLYILGPKPPAES